MPDYGARYTDKTINRVERELHGVYQQAKEELEDKLDEFYQKHKARDRMKRKQLADGKITRQEYQDWMNGQIFQREQWKRQIKQINHVLYDTNSQAVKIVNERRLDVFAENYNYFAYLGEQNPGISFELYDARSVARLIREHPQLLPEWKIDEEKDYIWNAKKVNNIVTQGIIQGEGVGEIAQRLSRDLSSQNENKMLMFARTAMTGAQNAGRQQCMEDTAAMGVDTHKKWVATLDKRTRDSHRHLDGQEVPYNEDFESDHGAIKYPGDPEADPAEVFNCRCTMVTIFPKYEDRTKRDWREDEMIEDQTYAEWKQGKKAQQNSGTEGRTVVQGKDITGTWKRRPDKFDFEIEDVINAQGFDGLPKVVTREEFDKAVKESGFIAQRSYSAPDQETLDSYRDQLYNGKWYVDCSIGSADYGQGMYCASDYTGTLTNGIETEMAHYQGIGRTRYGKNAANKVETFTLTSDAKIISYKKLRDLEEKKKQEITQSYIDEGLKNLKGLTEREEAYAAMRLMDVDSYKGYTYDEIRTWMKNLEGIEKDEVMSHLKESGYRNITMKAEEASEAFSKMDKGTKAALMGYDAIKVEDVGASGSYTVVLNRTKCVFLEDSND